MPKYYVLSGQKPVRVYDPVKWAHWCKTNLQDRVVGQINVNGKIVRTVFTGLDLESKRGRPYLFESYVWRIGADEPDVTERYCSWKAAVDGHHRMVEIAAHDRTTEFKERAAL